MKEKKTEKDNSLAIFLDNLKSEIRSKAIDEFIKRCRATNEGLITNWDKPYGITFEELDNIAEQLKAGGENEQSI